MFLQRCTEPSFDDRVQFALGNFFKLYQSITRCYKLQQTDAKSNECSHCRMTKNTPIVKQLRQHYATKSLYKIYNLYAKGVRSKFEFKFGTARDWVWKLALEKRMKVIFS